MRVGYARVSTADQSAGLQADSLWRAGCDEIREEVASGAKLDRPVLDEVLRNLRAGDTLIVWKLDRLGRSTRQLLAIADDLCRREIDLVIVTMGVDTSTPAGRMFFTVVAAFAEFERDVIRERTRAGLAAARSRGRAGGRPPSLTAQQKTEVRVLYGSGSTTVESIAESFHVSRGTVYRAIGETPVG